MKELINKNKINIIILISFLILGGILSLIQQQSCAWDLLRYHFYNAWAFLNNRLEVDLMPCGIQSYLNPIILKGYTMGFYTNGSKIVEAYQTKEQIEVETQKGLEIVEPYDYIVTGVYGEQYVYKPNEFENIYKIVKEEPRGV